VTSKLSIKSKYESPSIQFFCYDATLPGRLEREMKLAGYTSRPKYLNALLEKMLSLFPASANGSCLDALSNLVQLFESLPIERIREMAPTQNRNFDQMFKHLLEIALAYYAENSPLANSAGEVLLARNLLNLSDAGDYKGKHEGGAQKRGRKRAIRN
jgi:hypothetical protein